MNHKRVFAFAKGVLLAIVGILILGTIMGKTDSGEIITTCVCILSLFLIVQMLSSAKRRYIFSASEISFLWNNWTYRKIAYQDIKAIAISAACDRTFNPIYEKSTIPAIVISLYSSADTVPEWLQTTGRCVLPSAEEHLLARIYWDEPVAKELFERVIPHCVYTTDEAKNILSDVNFL